MDPSTLLVLGIAVIVGSWLLGRNLRSRPSPTIPRAGEHSEQDTALLYDLAARASGYFEFSASPGEVLANGEFMDGVTHLSGVAYTDGELLDYFTGDNVVVACMALEALSHRNTDPANGEAILAGFNDVAPWTRFFALRALQQHWPAERPLLGRLLTCLNPTWEYAPVARMLREFVERRIAEGEKPTFGDALATMPDKTASSFDVGPVPFGSWLERYLTELGDAVQPLLEELRRFRAGRVDVVALRGLGTVWDTPDAVPEPVPHPALERRLAELESELLQPSPRSVLLVGETGTGKTEAIHALGRKLKLEGYTIFEAGHAELLAGMSYVGQLEERLRTLTGQLGGRPVLWIVPQFHALSWAGKHQYERSSVLDYLLPFIERGEIRIVGETTPSGYQRVLRSKPRCRSALRAMTLEPLSADETLQLARDWIGRQTPEGAEPVADDATLQEAWGLAQQYMGTRAAPGSLLDLLSITLRRLRGGAATGAAEIRVDDLLSTLGSLTGLPASILDERRSLDLSDLRRHFESQVLGQPEAIDCLVERVAMIKAGVTDPTRPQCVFLLAGPTGTGKTEIAKTLADYLFGSPERMIRLDMSEFQDEASLTRILGESHGESQGDSLIDEVRKQPFSLVLLDEFEKAHHRVWDLFLQVFDDGRLTDRLGRTGDFRHALILITSNLGANIPAGLGLGFLDRSGAFSSAAVRREIDKVFRKEFLNRLDRVIVFRPLERETMRAIMRKELGEVFERRGLRNRQWAVEWDDAALEFLLAKGFTADMGARPLKRAIEQHLLAPLARTIVGHRFPAGDQFLFVTSTGSELSVRFVDPDAPAEAERVAEIPATEARTTRLQDLVLSPRGTVAELEQLRSVRDALAARAAAEELHAAKRMALEAVSAPGFWNSEDRFAVLGRAEYLDRIESALESSGSLLARLERMAGGRSTHAPRDLAGRLAQRLWLIGEAMDDVAQDRPTEAWLLVDAGYESGAAAMGSSPFARRLDSMYREWAGRRGMKLDVLETPSNGGEAPYRAILSVSGFAAWALLEPEDGVHVLEIPREDAKRAPVRRCAVRVRVAAQPDARVDDALASARRALTAPESAPPQIVRRYRETPSPLVRDLRRGWRTGLLDRVLGGDFDLI